MTDLPAIAWKRRVGDELIEHGIRREIPPLRTLLGFVGIAGRAHRYMNQERKAGREPYMDFFSTLDPGPVMGVPLGGIGGGTITRGWRGDFLRWQMRPGIYTYDHVPADQFSVYIQRAGKQASATVLNPHKPEGGELHGWGWGLTGEKSTYHALYPRAWTVYEEPDPQLRMTCRQISPVIAHNYEESSTPAATFVWTLENTGSEHVKVGLMFSFQNGMGTENDRGGGHSNHAFREEGMAGVELRHIHRQWKPLDEDQSLDEQEIQEDPLTFAIAAKEGNGVDVTYRSRFLTSASGMDLWGDFRDGGRLENREDEKPSTEGVAIGAAVCATVDVPAGETREVVFALAWDMPLARFGGGRAYYRRYTRRYGRDAKAAPAIARDALNNYADWEKQIEAWQKPILDNEDLPEWYRATLFNELYFVADGGTVWVDAEEGEDPLPEGDIGRFTYLEGHEYRMYSTYDVHFYASFALAMNWPRFELRIQRDLAEALDLEHPEILQMLADGVKAPRKAPGIIAHDIGAPTEDPWYKVNTYNYQDVSRWKDLNPKFVLQIYRDFVLTSDREFLAEMWPHIQTSMQSMEQFDLDEDGLIENDGYPDQTYDVWTAKGASAYSGGLWLASLTAAAAIADELGDTAKAAYYREMLERGKVSYEELLWNGDYYDYDASGSYHSTSVMADQLAGQWWTDACHLPPIVPPENAKSAFKEIYELNVTLFENGEIGAVNGMRPDGRVDTTCEQSQEVWAGTTYGLAAAMLHQGMDEIAWKTAWGVYNAVYEEFGYWFNTPEAWDHKGSHRSLGYMRPLAIWAMQWAWERRSE